MHELKTMDMAEFKTWLDKQKVKRKIKLIQLHHTYSPSYKHFDGSNHLTLHQNMKNYHVNTNGWNDIAQNFTIFPDGKIVPGRPLDKTPAGIYGANTNGICIECVGNFDAGGDVLTSSQQCAITGVLSLLLKKFGLDAQSGITYHAWWNSSGKNLGDFVLGKSVKTCPGTAFFGGNTRKAFEENLLPLLSESATKEVTEANDIVWELSNAKIITDGNLWLEKCKSDTNVYWLCRKMANYLRGTL